ncbi:DUF2298 domain-containing protein [Massilia sp. W12]|uniref:DUF2298 domain-containing protein n=1 Tax=Massilia sp. W12 TaxID=3126507 RepID=UPI0030CD4A34
MQQIHLLLSLGLLWLHLFALRLLLQPVFLPAVARAGGVLLLTAGFFFIEHFSGLGRLQWLLPLSTLAAALYIWRKRADWPAAWADEAVFGLCCAWGLLWKWLFPAIYPTSERVTDLYFITNYYDGVRLPAPDYWLAGYRFDFYYSFQHYGAALLGRWFGWEPAYAYNIAFVLLLGLGLSLAAGFVLRLLPQRKWGALLLLAALALGGTGATPFVRLIVQPSEQTAPLNRANDEMWAGVRFIGSYDMRANTEFGKRWFMPASQADLPSPDFQVRDLPMEVFGYHYYMGDYHPPLGGFFLLFLAMLLMLQIEQAAGTALRWQYALLAATAPLMLITNAWVVPLHGLLLAAWAGWRIWRKQGLDWAALFGGGLLAGLAIYPYLTHFSAYPPQTAIRLTQAVDHTPLPNFLLQMWPMLILFPLAWLQRRRLPVATLFALCFGAMLLAGEFLFVDDASADRFERTNTTMKWWGYMWSGGLLACGALALGAQQRWQRYLCAAVLAVLCSQAFFTAQYFVHGGRTYAGKLGGTEWMTGDQAVGDMVRWLRQAPRGVVMESWQGDAYTNQGLYALFARQQALLVWPHHISVWRNGAPGNWLRSKQMRELYEGQLPDPLAFLRQNQVRYLVWSRYEANNPNWETIHQAISAEYDWRPFQEDEGRKLGLWLRREAAAGNMADPAYR